MNGRLVPIGPVLERELALILEADAPAGELSRRVVSWAFDNALAMRSSVDPAIALVIVSRAGETRAVRFEAPAAAAPPPRREPRSEWTSMMPARRR